MKYLSNIKTSTATVNDDIPAKIIKKFAKKIAHPMTLIINNQIIRREFPDIWKIEQVTPVPKIYPAKKRKDLRKISVFKQLGKTSEKIISDMVIEDLSLSLDKSQYGNQRGIGIYHYLINLLNKVLSELDD